MTKTYTLTYDYQELATVEIDETPETAKLIEEMVQFWMNWDLELRLCHGDYTKCWLRKLAMFILRYGRAPSNDEGWSLLDGTQGITVKHVTPFEFDAYDIEIESV